MIGSVGIVDAARLPVDQAVMPAPNMRSTLLGWFRPIALTKVRTTMKDFESKTVDIPYTTSGVVQPFSATQLAIKPEGERAWKWWMISATPDLILGVGEIIDYRGTRLRIMRQAPYQENSFVQYEAIEDYNGA